MSAPEWILLYAKRKPYIENTLDLVKQKLHKAVRWGPCRLSHRSIICICCNGMSLIQKIINDNNRTQGYQPYPIWGYSTPFEPFVPQKKLYLWGTHFVPHLHFSMIRLLSSILWLKFGKFLSLYPTFTIEMHKIISYVYSIPCSNAFVEGVFSHMKSAWTASRNLMAIMKR